MKQPSYLKSKDFVMKKYLLFFTFLSFPGIVLANEPSDFPRAPDQKILSIDIGTEFYQTSQNFTDSSLWESLKPGAYFQTIAFKPKVTFFPIRRLSLHIKGEGMWARSFNGDERGKLLSEFHLNSYALGLAFHNDNRKPLYISGGLTAGGPLNQFAENTENLVTGCGCYFAELDAWGIYDFRSLVHIFYNTRLRYRSSGLSSLWFHKAGGYFQTRRFNFGLSANFFFPLFFGCLPTRTKKRTLVLQRVNAGSHKFYSINPMALSFTGWLELKAGIASVALYGDIDTFGKNYARGFTLGLSARVVFSMESDPSNYKNYKHLNEPVEEGKSQKNSFQKRMTALKKGITFPKKRIRRRKIYFRKREKEKKAKARKGKMKKAEERISFRKRKKMKKHKKILPLI